MVTAGLKEYLVNLNDSYKHIAWTHPRAILLIAVLVDHLQLKRMIEIGTWMGAVPMMLQQLQSRCGTNGLQTFDLIENFEDHSPPIDNPMALKNRINDAFPNLDITISQDLSSLSGSVDLIHFDSVKWQTQLLEQFETIKEHTHSHTLFVFDDYIAEWPDVIYCVDKIKEKHGYEVIATFGPKIYLGTASLKESILDYLSTQQRLLESFFNIRETIKHGLVISSGPELMI